MNNIIKFKIHIITTLLRVWLISCVLFNIAICFESCELFTTREPETPEQGQSNYKTPTTPEIVLENLKFSILEKNTVNYIKCLSNISLDSALKYSFVPSADAYARYKELFDSWDINSEQRYFNALVTNLGKDKHPEVSFDGWIPESTTQDSVIYNSNYNIKFDVNDEESIFNIIGTMRITIVKGKNGLYNINRWMDIRKTSDTTWSLLKAKFSN